MKTTIQKAITILKAAAIVMAIVVMGSVPLSCGKNPVDGGNGGGDQVSLAKLQATKWVDFNYTGVFQYKNYVGAIMSNPPSNIIVEPPAGTPNFTWSGTSFSTHYFATPTPGDTISYDVAGSVSPDGKKIVTLTITDRELVGLDFKDRQIIFLDIPFKTGGTSAYNFGLAGPGTQLQSHVSVVRDLRIAYSQRWAIATANDWEKYYQSLWGNLDDHEINIHFFP